MCRGRLTKLGTRPEKINEMWNVIDNTPKAAQKRRSNTDITNWLERWLEITPSQPVYILKLFLEEIFLTSVVLPAPEGDDNITIIPAFLSAIYVKN